VLNALQHWNGTKIRLHQAVVMPDHVHALIEPISNHDLSKVLHSVKSFTANEVNKALRAGKMPAPQHLWQPESFDRIVRDSVDYLQKWEYIRNNPIKAEICSNPKEYPWLYEDEVVRECSLEGCPPTWIPNVLAHDVEQWARWILERARGKIGHLYPPGKDGRPVVGYLWARTAPCSNPSCRGEIPLLRSLLVCNKKDKQVALTMEVVGGQASSLHGKGNRQDACPPTVKFGIAEGKAIEATDGTMQNRGNTLCPYCGQVTPVADLRTAGLEGRMGERMVAVITEDKGGKRYRPVEETDLAAFRAAAAIEVERPGELILPEINAEDADDVANSTGIRVHLYGMKTWGSLFNPRQLVAMQTFLECLREALEEMKREIADEEYRKAVGIYLGLWLSRIAQRSSNVGLWDTTRETLQHPFGRQAIPMTWDYPEANPFSESTGGAEEGLDWMTRVILHESTGVQPAAVTRGDGAALSLKSASCDVVVTDPPYFDAISYGDLSDYFYVWLKRGLAGVIPESLVTPLTPKADEATALKHRHAGDGGKADAHFKSKLAAVLAESHRVMKPDGVISIMFAHQSTKAWTALVSAIFEAGLTVDATWPIDTELTTALKASMSALSSSVTVICRPRVVGSAAAFRQVRKEIEQVVQESVRRFWSYGFRGADLIVACYGPAVGVFGKYERVEKADGTPVGIPELLDLAKRHRGRVPRRQPLDPLLCLGEPVRRGGAGLGRCPAGGADRRKRGQRHGGRPWARYLCGGRGQVPPCAACRSRRSPRTGDRSEPAAH
jgi:adenine-specific DNA methylase